MNRIFDRNGREDFDPCQNVCKSWLPDLNSINPQWQAPSNDGAGIICNEGVAVFVRIADEIDESSNAEALGISHAQSQDTRIVLPKSGKNKQQQDEIQAGAHNDLHGDDCHDSSRWEEAGMTQVITNATALLRNSSFYKLQTRR